MTKQTQQDKKAPRAWPGLAAGWTTRLIADEPAYDRRMLWRIGSWGATGIAALITAIYVAQSPATTNRQTAEARTEILLRQQERLQKLVSDSQNETRRLSSAVDVLNSDRDRTFARITSLEQNVETVTGSIARAAAAPAQTAAIPPPPILPANVASPMVASPMFAPPMAATPMLAPPATAPSIAASQTAAAPVVQAPLTTTANETRAEKQRPPANAAAAPAPRDQPAVTASIPDDKEAPAKADALPEIKGKPESAKNAPPAAEKPLAIAPVVDKPEPDMPAARTEFGVDLGGAASVKGLRALWGKSRKKYPEELANLRPVIAIRERKNGLGIQLRLLAGPLLDAAASARLCAAIVAQDKEQDCETTVFDGQQLPAIRQAKAAEPEKGAEPEKKNAEPAANSDKAKEARRRPRPQPVTGGFFPFSRN